MGGSSSPPWNWESPGWLFLLLLLLSLSMPNEIESPNSSKVPHKQNQVPTPPFSLGDFLPGAYRPGHRGPGTQRPPSAPEREGPKGKRSGR
jgi:hypothetical protein